MKEYQQFLLKAVHAAVSAGRAILDVYQTDFDVTHKADKSPLTLADQRSHEIINESLIPLGIPILSEEGREMPYSERQAWQRLWVIDPLDGTKEFIKRNDEFTVNIALVENNRPTLGVIYLPVKEVLYFAHQGLGSHKLDCRPCQQWLGSRTVGQDSNQLLADIMNKSQRLPLAGPKNRRFTIVGSRSHAGPELQAFIEQKRKEHDQIEFISAGSSIKICLVAEGTADIYPRTGPTCEWDTAAGQAIAELAGAQLLDFNKGTPLTYNREDVLNPWFIVQR